MSRLFLAVSLLSLLPLASADACIGFTKGDWSDDVNSAATCRSACETAEGGAFVNPDWKGESGKGKCQCVNSNSGSGETRDLCEDPDYEASSSDPCFHGDDTVALESGGTKAIKEVEVGDRILTADESGELAFSDVVFVPHAAGNTRATAFIELTLASGKTVRPTPRHLLKTCDGRLAPAGSLDLGTCLQSADGADVIQSKRPFEDRGAYTAVAMREFIVVSGVVASPFAFVHWAPNLYYQMHRWLYSAYPALIKSRTLHRANELVGDATVAAIALLLPILSL